jgi:hypothetical protein
MASADYRIFGLGLGTDDLRYIGWTHRSLSEEKEQIFGELVQRSRNGVAHWVGEALDRGGINIFEIESAPSMEDARNAAASLGRYFRSLGLDVLTDPS